MFIAVLFTITKVWKQPKCPSVHEWIKQLWYIYTTEYYLVVKKEGNLTLCNSVDGPGEHCAEWNKPVRERQVPYDLIHMWKLWTNWTNKQNRDRLIDREHADSSGGWRDWAKRKKDSWTWTTVWWLWGGGSLRMINGIGKKYSNSPPPRWFSILILSVNDLQIASLSP